MSRHNEFVKDFESKVASGFLFSDPKHISSLKSILIKACDISNECRPIAVSEKWVDNLLEEYFAQVFINSMYIQFTLVPGVQKNPIFFK